MKLEMVNTSLDQRFKILKTNFCFSDSCIFAAPNQDLRPFPIEVQSLDLVLMGHLTGHRKYRSQITSIKSGKKWSGITRLGKYVVQGEEASFLVIDIDGGPTHKHSLKDPLACCLDLQREAVTLGFESYLEKSFGGNGWHLWCLFNQPVRAAELRELGLYIARKRYPLANGQFSNALKNQGVEVFPKQTFVKKGDFGNLIWLPWAYSAKPGSNDFYITGENDVHLQ